MRFEVWSETKSEEPTYVKLIQIKSGGIQICVVDAEGRQLEGGTIAELAVSGLYRYSSLKPDYGFLLNDMGQIRDAGVEKA